MLPTFNRPQRLATLIYSALDNADIKERVHFCLCVHVSDNLTREALPSIIDGFANRVQIVDEDTDQPNLPYYFNKMYDETTHRDALVSMLGDDMRFMTPSWDTQVLTAIAQADGKAIVFGDDAYIAHDKLCVHFFTTRKIVEVTQKPFMCPIFHAEMIDVIWFLFGQSTETLRYLPDMVIKHEHDSGKKDEERDFTYMRMQPLRNQANSLANNQRIAFAYATVMAANAIKNGVGKWNVL
jgi:hypothetical protein